MTPMRKDNSQESFDKHVADIGGFNILEHFTSDQVIGYLKKYSIFVKKGDFEDDLDLHLHLEKVCDNLTEK